MEFACEVVWVALRSPSSFSVALTQENDAMNFFSEDRRRKTQTGWRPKNDEARLEFKKAVLGGGDEKQEDNLVSVQKDIVEAAGRVHTLPNLTGTEQ